MADDMQQLKKQQQQLEKRIDELRDRVKDIPSLAAATTHIPSIQTTLKCRKILKGHIGKMTSLHWADDSQHLVTAAQDGNLILWDCYRQMMRQRITLKSSWVATCAISPNYSSSSKRFLASGGLDNVCSVHDISDASNTSDEPVVELVGHAGYLTCCRFLPNGQIMTSSGDLSCALWDYSKNQLIRKFEGHTGDVMFLAMSEDNRTMVTGACDAKAKLWDVASGKCVQTFSGHSSDINCVAMFPGGNAFATASEDCTCKLYDIRADQEVNNFADSRLVTKGAGITAIGFSKSGRLLHSACDDGVTYTFDTLKTELTGELIGHDQKLRTLGVSPDGLAVATGSWDSTVRIWN